MLQMNYSAPSIKIKPAYAHFLKPNVFNVFSSDTVDNAILGFMEGWFKSTKYINAVVKQIVLKLFFIGQLAGFIMRHVGSIINE